MMSAAYQHDLFERRYPDAPGHRERGGTSEESARRITSHAKTVQTRVLMELRKREGTADEIAARIGEPILTVRPRVTELYRKGLVEKTTGRRPNASGMSARVWKATASE